MLSRHRSCRAMIAASFVLAALAGACRAAPESPEFNRQLTVVVMDPLAAPLSCPCVEGYAQRRYEVLGEYLSRRLKQLEQRGLIRLDRGQVRIVDVDRLRKIAGPLRNSSH